MHVVEGLEGPHDLRTALPFSFYSLWRASLPQGLKHRVSGPRRRQCRVRPNWGCGAATPLAAHLKAQPQLQ